MTTRPGRTAGFLGFTRHAGEILEPEGATLRNRKMLHARCDESYAGDARTTPVYVVAGLVGTTREWELFDSFWSESMRDLRIDRVGCHTSKCANGAKPYDQMSAERRREIQHRLLVDIIAARLYGCVAVSDLDSYRRVKPQLDALIGRDLKKLNEPHLLAVRQCVLLMLHETQSSDNHPISFVFDRNGQFGGRVKEWYHGLVRWKAFPFRGRVGPFVEGDRNKVIGLQAADMLAYAALRHFTGRPSWQWDALSGGTRIASMTFADDYWQSLMASTAKEMGKPDLTEVL